MQKTLLLIVGLVLLAAGAFAVPHLLGSDEPPVVRWDAADEVDAPRDEAATESGEPTAVDGQIERSEVAAGEVPIGTDERVDAVLRGRVVDKFTQPVAGATVWLEIGRGGGRGGRGTQQAQRRVPDPVTTDREGRFAFQGQAYRNLRVTLQVAHAQHAVGLFDKDLGAIGAEVDLGDLTLMLGGTVLGRVTDLDGNGIAGASVERQPDNANRLRFVRDREKLLPAILTDNNGFYRIQHLAEGDWSLRVLAKNHTEGRSPTFVVEEAQQVDLEDIRLGPGYEVTGYVRDTRGQPIAKANVSMRSRGNGPQGRSPGGGRGGPGMNFFGGRDHSTTTDAQGRFFLEHLPGSPMSLEVRAAEFLDHNQEEVDPKLGQPLQIAMQDGLRITGRVLDGVDNSPVLVFAKRANRVRGLPVPGTENVDIGALMTRMRDGNLSDAERQQIRTQMESLRGQFGGNRRGGQPDGQDGADNGGGRGGRDLGKPERHADGQFVIGGLQEGVYEVTIESADHTRYTSQEVEVRGGVAPPTLAVALDRGVYVAGVVMDDRGQPVADARVELRPDAGTNQNGGGQRGQRGQRGQDAGGQPDFTAMAQQFAQQMRTFQQTLDTRTNAEGEFIFKHTARGTYRLNASARNFADTQTDVLTIDADKSGIELRMGVLGSIVGTVRGFREGEHGEVRVGAIVVGGNNGGGIGAMFRGRGGPGGNGGPFRTAEIAADGSYRLADLEPGNYLVRSWVGSPQELMRELGPQMFSGELQADVTVKGGQDSRLDLTLVRPQVGTVVGLVLHNGAPAKGFAVELQRTDNSGGGTADAGFGGRGGRGFMMFGRSQRGTVSASGRFEIKDVPAGQYRLQVTAGDNGGGGGRGGRGGGGGSALFEESIVVVADATLERSISVSTGSLEGNLADDGSGAIGGRSSATLLLGVNEMPADYNAFRRQGDVTTYDARVQDGKFRFDAVPPGNYLLVVSVQGRERVAQPVSIGAGTTSVTVQPGKPSETTGATAPGGRAPAAPGAGPGGQGRGGAPGAGPGGQGRGGR